MEQARIHLHRRRTPYTDRARAYKVLIDGEVVSSIRHGEDKTYDLPPGDHLVQLRIDWAGSEAITVNLSAGEEIRLVCHGRNPLLALYWITFGRNRYIGLEVAGAAA